MRHGGNVWDTGTPEQWLDFSANLRPEGTLPWVMDVMRDALSNTRYYPDRSMKAARKGLAAYAKVDESCILPTAGGAQAIDLVLGDGDGRVLLQSPTFGEYAERAAVHGRTVAADTGDYQQGDTLVRCNPNNPTGHAWSCGELLALADQACAAGAELLVDEAFIDFCPQNSVREHVHTGLTVVGSLTKTLCIPGVRLGYVIADPQRILRLQRRMVTWSLGTLANAVAAALPMHLQEISADRQVNVVRRTAMAQQLDALGVSVMPSEANFLLCRFDTDTEALVQALKQQHILVRTCTSFGLDTHYLRLAVKTEEQNARLISAIRAWKEQTTCAANH